jgi:hypothetical protein
MPSTFFWGGDAGVRQPVPQESKFLRAELALLPIHDQAIVLAPLEEKVEVLDV